MAKKIGIILAGCGVKDGSEIHESVLALLHVVKQGAEPRFFAPDGPQFDVVNHLSNSPLSEKRDMKIEAARIARGEIQSLSQARASDLDAVILPGGFGAAKNLCSYATRGVEMAVNGELDALLVALHRLKKPIGAICIAPVIVAKVFGSRGIPLALTVGTDRTTMGHLEAMGARPLAKRVDEIATDEANRVVTTPAYMLAQNIAEAAAGIEKLVTQLIAWA